MADTVFQRVVFAEQTKDGFFRFAGWALATTGLGAMAEPFNLQQVSRVGDSAVPFDATDDMALISTIHIESADMVPTRLSGGGPVWVGGCLMPRTGR